MGLDSNRSCQSGEQWRWKESGVVPIPAVTSSLQKQDQKRRFSGNGGQLWLCRIALSPPVINTAPSPLWERTILLPGWKQELHKETVEINRVVFWADWLNSFIPHTFAKHLLCPTSLVAQQQSARLPREKIGMPSPSHEDPLRKEMATHSSILAWENPMDRGVWCMTAHGVAESDTTLSLK